MALSNKQKSYIRKHKGKKSAKDIAKDLNLQEHDVQAYLDELNTPLPLKKKIFFYGITLSIPVLFFIILELTLRGIDYMGNTDLFSDPKIPTDEYLIPNPNFAARYFFYTNVIPSPSIDVFLKNKPENSYRVFAMGGSTAAGYPYGFNGTFSRVVDDVLQDAMPDKNIEVVNVGVSAVNSYTLYDQLDEIIEHKPDAIMIYAGHNEFYGALGVGSNENLGAFPGFVRFYLKLQRFKTFLFLRNVIVDTGKWFASVFGDGQAEPQGTLMERIVNSRSIELNSTKYQMAMLQFESNLSEILNTFTEKGIPVYLASVASNLKDHPPFVDAGTSSEIEPSAFEVFESGLEAYKERNYEKARRRFIKAKDLDGLKFRAPSEINEIIKKLASENTNVTYVPVEEAFFNASQDGIIGFNLMLEHLHPNKEGYFLIGKTFAQSMLNSMDDEIGDLFAVSDWEKYLNEMYLTYFDDRVEWHRIRTLKQGFPFIQGAKPRGYQFSYKPEDFVDSLAFASVHQELGWDRAKVSAADFYEKTNQMDKAIQEYLGLIRNQPWNDSPYVFAARIYLDQNRFNEAEPLLRKAYEINPEDAFITKMLGAIELNRGNVQPAIELLEKSVSINPQDPQALFNLSGAYGTNQQFEKALETADKVSQLSPNFPGLRGWKLQLQQIIQSRN